MVLGGTFLVVEWLGISLPIKKRQILVLVWELRSHTD